MGVTDNNHPDFTLAALCGTWASTDRIYQDANDNDAPVEISRDADVLLGQLEAQICKYDAMTLEGAMLKLQVFKAYEHEENCHPARSAALAASFARNVLAISDRRTAA